MYPKVARTCYIAENDPELLLLLPFPLRPATTCRLGACRESNLVWASSQTLYQLSYTTQPQSTRYLHPHTLAMYLHVILPALTLPLSPAFFIYYEGTGPDGATLRSLYWGNTGGLFHQLLRQQQSHQLLEMTSLNASLRMSKPLRRLLLLLLGLLQKGGINQKDKKVLLGHLTFSNLL